MDSEPKQLTSTAQNNQDLTSFFNQNEVFVFMFKKTEKLASAVYMVSNLFPENEPMRATLRKKVSEFLSFILTYKEVSETSLGDFTYLAKTKVLEIVSLLEVSMLGGLVSSMNFSVLKTEFSNLIETLISSTSGIKENGREVVPSSFFEIPLPDLRNRQQESYQYPPAYRPASSSGVPNTSPSGTIKDAEVQGNVVKRSNRQNVILSLIKKRREVTIKDISLVIKDCSEKTIQRELNSFIEAGVLKRVGERRWSRYSFA